MSDSLTNKRHTLAHLLAAAIRTDFPHAKPTIGPAIDTGFYYDFDFSGGNAPVDADLPRIEKKMRALLPLWKEFTHAEVDADGASELFLENPYKKELISELKEKGETITLYTVGTDHAQFTDLCRGGHSEDPASDISPDSFHAHLWARL